MLDALRDTPADYYEAITCTDVLVYVGDLTPVIPNAHRILKAGGHFIFTCEAAADEEPDMVMRGAKRYAHKASHVERLCREAGFDVCASSTTRPCAWKTTSRCRAFWSSPTSPPPDPAMLRFDLLATDPPATPAAGA